MAEAVESAKCVLEHNEVVLYGIFGMIRESGYFPPRDFLNDFLMGGSDPCDQDKRMSDWEPFSLSPIEYDQLTAWWVIKHPGTLVSDLGVGCWNDWVQVILNPEEFSFPDGLQHKAEPSVAPDGDKVS